MCYIGLFVALCLARFRVLPAESDNKIKQKPEMCTNSCAIFFCATKKIQGIHWTNMPQSSAMPQFSCPFFSPPPVGD